jgi:riboflavin synthase
MFTGLIEQVGILTAADPVPGGRRLTCATSFPDLQLGESVAVNGVCLTVAGILDGGFAADVGPETLRVTSLGSLRPGSRVNLERAMRADARFGGHFVQGHVDGVGRVEALRTEGGSHWMTVSYPQADASGLIPKGAVAVDGISLTVASLTPDRFDVMIVPFTWTNTNLQARRVGDLVNLEYDMVGKYVVRALELGKRTDEP